MKKLHLSIIMLCVISLLVSCQQTPDSEVVINKGNDTFYSALAQENPTEIYPFDFPDTWKADFEKYNGKFKMSIEADIIIEDVSRYPVAKIKPYHIPIDQAKKIVTGIFGDQDVYFNNYERTKDQIETMLIEVKAEYQQAKNDGDEENEKELLEVIESLTERIQDAPEEVNLEKFDGEFKIYDDGEFEEIALRANPLDINTPVLGIHNVIDLPYSNGYSSNVLYEDYNRETFLYRDDNMDLDYREKPIFNTDAAKKAIDDANTFIEYIGIENVEIDYMYAYKSDEASDDITSYQMFYSRKFNDIQIPLLVQMGGSKTSSDDEEYIYPFRSESLVVEIEGDKIVYFEWSSMYQIDTTINENIALLPFEEIMSNAENQFAAKFAYLDDQDLRYELYVDKIMLTYAIEPIKDEKFEYMLIPVWAFYGGYDYGDGCEISDGSILKGRYKEPASLLTINAVDGSLITGK